MKSKKNVDPLPEEFASYEEAAEFWDSHDTTDYPESFKTVAVDAQFMRRRYEVEIDEDIIKALYGQAQSRGVTVSRLISDMLREKIHSAA